MINLNNYEEYFLLYIDNELSKEQREAVDIFVQQHPHLATELEMLGGTKLLPEDEVLFSNKALLYKAADSSVNINNYEEYFLLHTDKELSATQEEEVEQFVLQHPQLQEEFLLLQSAKLTPELIECPDKQGLYKQQSERRIIPLYITRMAVAAAIASVIVLAGNLLINSSSKHPQVADNAPQSNPVNENVTPRKDADIILPEKKSSDVEVAKNEIKKADKIRVKSTKIIDKEPALNDSSSKNNTKDNEPVIAQINPLPNIQQTAPPSENVVATIDVPAKHEQPTALKLLDEVSEKEPASTVMYVSNEDAITKPAVYKELNTDEDDQTLYVGSLQLNKAKVNGLFKKAAHLLGGKAKESNL